MIENKRARQRGNINKDAYNQLNISEGESFKGALQCRLLPPFNQRMNDFELKAREMEKERGKIGAPLFNTSSQRDPKK